MTFQALCPCCGHKYTFDGKTADDKPPCPACGHRAHVYKDPPPTTDDSPLYREPKDNALFDRGGT